MEKQAFIELDGGVKGTLVFSLNPSPTAAKSVENFEFLCTCHALSEEDKRERCSNNSLPLPLLGTLLTRIVPGEQLELGSSHLTSMHGGFFEEQGVITDKRYSHHSGRGIIAQLNCGGKTCASRYSLLLGVQDTAKENDSMFPVVARLIEGYEILDKLEEWSKRHSEIQLAARRKGKQLPPSNDSRVTISKCGIVHSVPAGEKLKVARRKRGIVRTRAEVEAEEATSGGFFSHSATDEANGQSLKKRRTEKAIFTYSPGSIEEPSRVLVSSAKPMPRNSLTEEERSVRDASILAAQQRLFAADLQEVKEIHKNRSTRKFVKAKRHK